jgi:DNA-binding transcriptional LysR family regulator
MAGLQLRADQTWLFDATFQEVSTWVSDHGLDQASLNGLPLALNSMVLSAAHADAGFAVQPRAVIDRDLEAGHLALVYEQKIKVLGYYMVTQPGVICDKLTKLIR